MTTVEIDGKLWKPLPGAAVTAEEFAAAQVVLREVHSLMRWNPWVLEDRAAEYEVAAQACGQWTRAEPGFKRKSAEELEAEVEQRLADAEARAAAGQEQAEKDRAGRAACYDRERALARLELLEAQGLLADDVRERDQIRSRDLYPLMDEEQRLKRLARLETAITAAARTVSDLAGVVGDPEAVADERGWLPAERRDLSLSLFSSQRISEVRELRARVQERQAELKTLKGRAERAELRKALKKDTARLAFLEAMPPMTAGGMCPECVNPAEHSMSTTISDEGMTGGPCPAWPRWTAKVEALRRYLLEQSSRPASPPVGPPAPPLEPIAVIEAGVPIEDVMAQLAAVQATHPGAQVRQGKRNRWEIWPPVVPQPSDWTARPGT